MERLSIGEFATRSRLSHKALRLYDELGLLTPAAVDPDTGYRSYEVAQLEQARLVAALRRIAVPLAEIKAIPTSRCHRGPLRAGPRSTSRCHCARGDAAIRRDADVHE